MMDDTAPRSISAPGLGAVMALSLAILLALTPGPARAQVGSASTGPSGADAELPPPLPREFRAAWIASVANIDWPSEPGLPEAQVKAELLAIFDRLVELNMNAAVLQIRPTGDALYRSRLEPWSEWLTGEAGKAPAGNWDPLAFAVEQAHQRGLELHVWFNPYRAYHPAAEGVAPNSLAARRPDLVKDYGRYKWMDPGEPEVMEHSLAVVFDVVERYDIDGIHVDDYFYPYPVREEGKVVPFPDDPSWEKYRRSGGTLSRDDWRRDNVNRFVQRMYEGTKQRRPEVKVGISPFGLYRPGIPHWVQGFDQYASLYADPLLWFREGWLDYLTPQLYWPIDQKPQSFSGLLAWWNEQNAAGRHLWPGLAVYRHFSTPEKYPAYEFLRQIDIARGYTDGSDGHIHFSMKWLQPGRMPEEHREASEALCELLRGSVYREPALTPATPWLIRTGAREPGEVRVTDLEVAEASVSVAANPVSLEDSLVWAVQVKRGGVWSSAITPSVRPRVTVATGGGEVQAVWVQAVNRIGLSSGPTPVPGRFLPSR